MSWQKDIIVLVADKDIEAVIKNLLEHRCESLKIQPVSFEIIVLSSGHDAACFSRAAKMLESYAKTHHKAIVIFDRMGCGAEERGRNELEEKVKNDIEKTGWDEGRASVLCIDPELEVWIWSDSPQVANCLGWRQTDLDKWLRRNGHKRDTSTKPREPKKAMREALKTKKTRRSSSIFGNIAKKVSLDRCEDPAFLKLKKELRNWFPL